jgi:hypothetical protein
MCANPHKSSGCSAGIVELLKSDSYIHGLTKTQFLTRIEAGLGMDDCFGKTFYYAQPSLREAHPARPHPSKI